jgi:tetratricopeptide (TPR) repeat protein
MNSTAQVRHLHHPSPMIPTVPTVEILEAAAGSSHRMAVNARLCESAADRERTFIVSCDFGIGGPWAGVNDLFSSLMDDILSHRPELATLHALELTYVLPALRKTVSPHGFPTDASPREERVRQYAADRALRLVHGLIDLLDSWKTAVCPAAVWCIACEDYDRAGAISRYFFRELMRRRGRLLNIRLIVTVGPGRGNEVSQWFDSSTEVVTSSPNVPDDGIPSMPTAELAAQLATDLERQIVGDADAAEGRAPYLLHLWTLANRDDKVLHWKCVATDLCLRRGLYEDALRYATGLLQLAEKCAPDDQTLRLWIVSKTLNGYMGVQDHRGGVAFVEEVVLPILESPASRQHIDLFFSVAMIYARYKKPRDLVKGESFLERGLATLKQIDLSPADYHLSYVFNRNGVAMIRSFEGRFEEAIDLCRAGIRQLNQHLGCDKHSLQRSVLVYNIAQVCFAMGDHAEAVEHYTAVIKLNPEDPEYYNERGNILLLLGRFEEARADYSKAIQLSPPYHEFHTNLGQCYRRMSKFREAIASYTRALDLRANLNLALIGRGNSHEELGENEQAITDYSAALEVDPSQWEIVANRGVLKYGAGNLAESLADFDRAIELSPDQSDLYRNRSIVLRDLARHEEAASDLRIALRLAS